MNRLTFVSPLTHFYALYLCCDRWGFCQCEGSTQQKGQGGWKTGAQEIIEQDLQSRVQLTIHSEPDEQVVDKILWHSGPCTQQDDWDGGGIWRVKRWKSRFIIMHTTWLESSISHRRPLDERLHERDLEAAITLSLLNNADGIKDQSPTSKGMLWLWNV